MSNMQRDAKGYFFGWGVLVVGLLLSVYSAFHQFSFIQIALPPNQKEWGYLGILAFDIGMLFWAGSFMFHARGDAQHIIAGMMTAVSFFGVGAGLVMDTFLQIGRNGYAGRPDAGVVDTVTWVSVGVMLLHIASGILYIFLDPGNNERKRQEKLRSKIEAEAWKMSDQQVEVLAAQLAPRIASDQMLRLQARYTAGLGRLPASGSARQVALPAKRAKVKLADSVRNVANMRLVEDKPRRAAQPIYNPQPEVYQDSEDESEGPEQPQFQAEDFYHEAEPAQEELLQEPDFLAQAPAQRPEKIMIRNNGKLVK